MDKNTAYYDPETGKFVTSKEQSSSTLLRRTFVTGGLAVVLGCLLFWGMKWSVGSPEQLWNQTKNALLTQELQTTQGNLQQYKQQLSKLSHRSQALYRPVLQLDSSETTPFGIGGALPPYKIAGNTDNDLLLTTEQTLAELEEQITHQRQNYAQLMKLAQSRQAQFLQRPAILPANGKVSSGYGMRFHPIYRSWRMHEGLDLDTDVGTPVFATGNGIVSFAGRNGGYGRCVYVKHPDTGYETRYAHLSEIPDKIKEDTRVKRGDLIGYSGNSGLSTGPHLHYEVRDSTGKALNPLHFFIPGMTPKRYENRSLAGSLASVEGPDTAQETVAVN